MRADRSKIFRALGIVAVVLVLVGAVAAARMADLKGLIDHWRGPAETPTSEGGASSAEPVAGRPETVRLPSDVVQVLRLQTAEARRPTESRKLELSGKLALDSNHLARVHARFAGEIVKLGESTDDRRPGGRTRLRTLRPSDRVEAGQLLAVVWSKELGETKSALVDSLSALRLDQDRLDRLEKAERNGAVSETSVQLAQRAVEGDRIAVDKAERTLRAWRLTEEEIDAVRAEAKRVAENRGTQNREKGRDWAKVEVRAPFGGTIVEKNVVLGDIVDTGTDLFKIADLDTLAVWADAYEEDLRDLLALPEEEKWTIRLKGDPDAEPLVGVIDYVGEIIDSAQHTALVAGRVDNPQHRLRANQFITATVALLPFPHEVLIPVTALVEDGKTSVVFVQEVPGQPEYTMRRVVVRRRLPGFVAVRSRLSRQEEKQGLRPLQPGALVVNRGAVELKKALEEIQGRTKGGE